MMSDHWERDRYEVLPDVDHIVLIGLMGAGKTTTGRLLASRLGWAYVDTDAIIEAETGRTIRELWDEGGEAAFRPHERTAVLDALAESRRTVLAAPGGAVDDEAVVTAIQAADAAVVYLRAEVPTLVERVGLEPGHRPLIDDRPEELLATMLARRDERYSSLAQLIIDVDVLDPDETVDAVLAGLVGVAFRPRR